jgi:hypothetical protein
MVSSHFHEEEFSMKRIIAVGAFVALALTGASLAADDLKSGPQVGDNGRPAPFTPLNLNGPTAGQKQCLV